MRGFYLDANVLIDFVDPSGRYHQRLAYLLDFVRSRACLVYGSSELIEELCCSRKLGPKDRRHRVNGFWKIVRANVLLPWQRLMHEEIAKGHRLSRTESVLDRLTVARLDDATRDARFCGTVGEETLAVKGRSATGFNESAKRAMERLRQLGADVRVVGKAATCVSKESIQSWYAKYLERHASSLHLTSRTHPWPAVDRVPCSAAAFAYLLAQIRVCLLTQTKWKPGDRYDLAHYVYSSVPGCLITDDGALTNAIDQIEWRPIPKMSGMQFLRFLQGNTQSS